MHTAGHFPVRWGQRVSCLCVLKFPSWLALSPRRWKHSEHFPSQFLDPFGSVSYDPSASTGVCVCVRRRSWESEFYSALDRSNGPPMSTIRKRLKEKNGWKRTLFLLFLLCSGALVGRRINPCEKYEHVFCPTVPFPLRTSARFCAAEHGIDAEKLEFWGTFCFICLKVSSLDLIFE